MLLTDCNGSQVFYKSVLLTACLERDELQNLFTHEFLNSLQLYLFVFSSLKFILLLLIIRMSYVSPSFCHCSEAADAWHWRYLELVYMDSKSITMLKNILSRFHNNLANKLFIIPWNNSLNRWQETGGSMAIKSVGISLFIVKDE